MLKSLKKFIKRCLKPFYIKLKSFLYLIRCNKILNAAKKDKNSKVFYLGITEHSNLGDLAQRLCIGKWIEGNFKCNRYQISSDALVNYKVLYNKFQSIFNDKHDVIVFQSGYTTQDLGGNHDLMHRMIISALPSAKIIMMPQTIFFKSEERKRLSSQIYSTAENMLFLARDRVSYGYALGMFNNIKIRQFPDIVTSLVGSFKFENKRQGILFCCRNDSEKYYSDSDINKLKTRLSSIRETKLSDTQSKYGYKKLIKDLYSYVYSEINEYSKFELVITDRYHGTIFSLAANTPVIVLKTTDHKVITGVEWFKGIYEGYYYLANDLNDAYNIAQEILKKEFSYELKPYFKEEYYDKLLGYAENIWNKTKYN